MKKENKPYFYCPECGYIGTKENPKSCNHFKYKQLENYEPVKYTGNGTYLVSTHLSNFIYKNTWMTSRLKAIEDGRLTIMMYFTKTMSNKPRSLTYKTVEVLTKLGFNLEFYDQPDIDADNPKLVKLLSEIHSRLKKIYRENNPMKFMIKMNNSENNLNWWELKADEIELTSDFIHDDINRYTYNESDFGNGFPPIVGSMSNKFIVNTDYVFIDESITKIFTYANAVNGQLIKLQEFDLI